MPFMPRCEHNYRTDRNECPPCLREEIAALREALINTGEALAAHADVGTQASCGAADAIAWASGYDIRETR